MIAGAKITPCITTTLQFLIYSSAGMCPSVVMRTLICISSARLSTIGRLANLAMSDGLGGLVGKAVADFHVATACGYSSII